MRSHERETLSLSRYSSSLLTLREEETSESFRSYMREVEEYEIESSSEI